MLDIRRMKVLREVAAHGSFSAAADAMNFTQSAVSQHIAALERETGTQLVERGARGIRLTDAGRALVTHADGILARLDDAEEELAAIAGLRGGRLRVGSFQSAGATLVPRAVAVFKHRHPDVELSMVEGEPSETVRRLKAGELDVALVYDYLPLPQDYDDDLELTHLLDDELMLVLPRGHDLLERSAIRLDALSEESWISGTGRDSCRRMFVHACNAAGFEPRVAFESDDGHAVQAFVAAGVGVALEPRLALTTVHPQVEVRSLGRKAPTRRIWAARSALAYRSPASEAMLEVLREVSEEFAAREKLSAVS